MTGRWLNRLNYMVAAWFVPNVQKPANPYQVAAHRAWKELERDRVELAELEQQAIADAYVARPHRETTRYASGLPHPSGLGIDQAALAAVRARGLPCNIPATALAEGISYGRIANASYLLGHAPDLAELVDAGELGIWYAALVARLRERGHTDLLARAEKHLPDLNPQRRGDRYQRAYKAMRRINQQSIKRHERQRDRTRKDSTK